MTAITNTVLCRISRRAWLVWLSVVLVLIVAVALGRRHSLVYMSPLVAVAGVIVLLHFPPLGSFGLIAAAPDVPIEVSIGTEVNLKSLALLMPVLKLIWLLAYLRHQGVRLPAPSWLTTPWRFSCWRPRYRCSLVTPTGSAPCPISPRTSCRFTPLRKPCMTGQLSHSLLHKLAIAARWFVEQHYEWPFIRLHFLRLVTDVAHRRTP